MSRSWLTYDWLIEGNVLLAEETSCFDGSLGLVKSALCKGNLIL
jgi:hypothetical protein